jgi:hypothetical protein
MSARMDGALAWAAEARRERTHGVTLRDGDEEERAHYVG